MNKIYILSKQRFNFVINDNKITDDNVEEKNTTAFISINDSKNDFSFFKFDHPNVLRLYFEDITQPLEDYKLFDINDAIKIIKFVENNKDKSYLVHCHAGISRSAAVGTFINDYYHIMDKDEFKRLNSYISPNWFIYEMLVKTFNDLNNENTI